MDGHLFMRNLNRFNWGKNYTQLQKHIYKEIFIALGKKKGTTKKIFVNNLAGCSCSSGWARQVKAGLSAALAGQQTPQEAAPGAEPAAPRLSHLPRPFGSTQEGRGGAQRFPGASRCLPLATESQQPLLGGVKPDTPPPPPEQPAREPAGGKVGDRGGVWERAGGHPAAQKRGWGEVLLRGKLLAGGGVSHVGKRQEVLRLREVLEGG